MAYKFRDIDHKYGDILHYVEEKIAESKKEGDIYKIQFYSLLIEALRDSHFGSGVAIIFLEMESKKEVQISNDIQAVLCNNCDGTFILCKCSKDHGDVHLHCIRCNGTLPAYYRQEI